MTVMIVEDDHAINEVVSEYLKAAGYETISVFDGETALKMIHNSGISLFILDIMLPGASGMEILKAIRAREAGLSKPVMMLTAMNDEYTQLQSFIDLADDYVTKPFSPRVLVKRVQALLRRTDGNTPQEELLPKGQLIGGSLSVDMDGYEAFEDGEKLPLTLREMELLKHLLQNRRRVLSRQQLLDAVWGYDYYGDERIVDVHIKNLRKKMRHPLITTVKGVGYKLEV